MGKFRWEICKIINFSQNEIFPLRTYAFGYDFSNIFFFHPIYGAEHPVYIA